MKFLSTKKTTGFGRIKISLLLSMVFILWSAVGPVWADTVGVAVTGVGSSTPAGLVPLADGTITFYIPLTSGASGTYGVKGTSSSSCVYPSTCTGGTLDMFLRFSPAQIGPNILSLSFNDLDLTGVNDPINFLESVKVLPDGGPAFTLFDESTDTGVISADHDNQFIQLPVVVGTNPFYVELSFKTTFLPTTPQGTWTNTPETVRATIATPEPATLGMLSLGIVALGLARRRKDWKG